MRGHATHAEEEKKRGKDFPDQTVDSRCTGFFPPFPVSDPDAFSAISDSRATARKRKKAFASAAMDAIRVNSPTAALKRDTGRKGIGTKARGSNLVFLFESRREMG